jgi:hypothetical protein
MAELIQKMSEEKMERDEKKKWSFSRRNRRKIKSRCH